MNQLMKFNKDNNMNNLPRIMQETDSYVRHYPEIVNLCNKQLDKQFWTSTEMKVHLDKMQMLYVLSPQQLHSIKFLLNLFLKYELMVGDFWQNTVAKTFPRPEIKMVSSVVDAIERAVHAEFYNQLNIQLELDTDEHYTAYTRSPELLERVHWLDNILANEDKILACIIFSMTETVLLFSSFAILKSFQSNGYNLIPVTVRGTNQSAIDEDLHGQIMAEIINTYYAEIGSSLKEDQVRLPIVLEAIQHAYDHECTVVDLAIPGDSLNGVDKQEHKEFIKHRFNIYANRLGLDDVFEVGQCSVINWFENNTYAYKVADFFTPGMGMEYETSWNETAFTSAWENKELQ